MSQRAASAPRRGIHEVGILLATRSWMLAAGLVTQALLARILAPEGRGIFAACTLFASVFGVFFALGTDRGAQYQMMSGQLSLSRSTSVGLLVALGAATLAIVIAIPLGETELGFFQTVEPGPFRVALCLIPITLAGSLIDMQLSGSRRFVFLARGILIQSTLYLIALLLFVWQLSLGVVGAVLASVLAAGSKLAHGVWVLAAREGLRLERPRRSDLRRVLTYGVAYYPARVGVHIDLQLGGLLLAAVGTREELGFYSAATALVFRLFIVSDSLEAVILPRIAGTPAQGGDLVGRIVRVSGIATGLAGLALVLLALPVVRLLFSDSFLPSVELIWLLVPGTALYGAAKPLMAFLRGTDRAALCSWATWVGLGVNAALLVALYPRLGAASAAWSLTAGFALRSLFLAIAYRWITGRSLTETWCPQREDMSWALSQVRSG